MRMNCPNCGAQYEVDDNVIPDNGRDVQCSNCGHTWFHRHGDQETDMAEELGADVSVDLADTHVGETENAPAEIDKDTSVDKAEQAPQESDVQDGGDQPEAQDEPNIQDEREVHVGAEHTVDKEVSTGSQDPPTKQPLDGGVASILREEAERETAERATDAGGLEMQPDLGLQQGPDQTHANIQERMARLRGMDDDITGSKAVAAVSVSKRRDLLPDIEEINSTLTASSDGAGDGADIIEQEKRRRSSFRLGFALTVLLFAVMALVYVYAPQIVNLAPQTEPYLADYVDWINDLRTSVDAMMQRAVDRLTGLLAQISSEGSE